MKGRRASSGPGTDRFPVGGLAIAAVVALAPFLLSGYWLRILTIVALTGVVATGVNLTYGFAGELALHHAAVYAVGAFVGGISMNGGVPVGLALVLALLAALVLGLVTGLPGLRLSGWPLALLTFFMVFLVPDVAEILKGQTGGYGGLPIEVYWSTRSWFWVTWGFTVTWMFGFRNLLTSQWGGAFKVLRQSPQLAESLGIDAVRLKLAAYVAGAIPAGVCGALFALGQGFVGPSDFSLQLAIMFLVAAVLGGLGSIYGPFVGAAVLVVLPEKLTAFERYSVAAYGIALVAAAVFVPGGGAGVARRLIHSRAGGGRPAGAGEEAVAATAPISTLSAIAEPMALVVDGVSKAFDGNVALLDVSLECRPGEITGLVGPNGSGKTTLLNVINGYVRPDAGAVHLGGAPLPMGRPSRVARHRVARTFQTPRLPAGMTTLDAVAVALFPRRRWNVLQAAVRTSRWRRETDAERRQALEVLGWLGLVQQADLPAEVLSLGQKRLLEIARALVQSPAVLLLDEPASGLSEAEIRLLAEVLRRLKERGLTVVLVEHNSELVLSIADRVYCLAAGSVLADGPAREVLEDERVVEAWIGQATDHSGVGHEGEGGSQGVEAPC
ncbi:MAG: branched-chain amino acid transporter substrate-binding protein [Actinomycetia bacterium]|nr:branched-chain amino acid transporter substrate-binding protein [Actinomycetes bacterium]